MCSTLLVSPRCYKQLRTFGDTLDPLRKEAGGHFDPALVEGAAGMEERLHGVYAAFSDKE